MRKQLLSVFLPWLLLGLVASAAETPASQPASQRNELQRVNVVRGTDEIRIEINARGALTPKLRTADSPARLVLDLPGTVMATGQSYIPVGNSVVKGVRIGTDGQTPPTTRVVVDLERACRHELNPMADGKLVLTLYAQQAASSANVPKTVAAAASSPATTQKPEAAAATSSDFVFVEPAYDTKKTAVDPSADPAGRAQDAAAKFDDKTAAELLPVSMNAAQAAQSASSGTGITPAVNLAAEQKQQAGQLPVATGPKYTGEPISVNLKDVDLKDFFRLIHEISGLNVVLDRGHTEERSGWAACPGGS
jgi:type IV pilus assembly protein PilQ